MIQHPQQPKKMNMDFARMLIEAPGAFTTQRLFKERHVGIFWVDWREADGDIVSLAAAAIGRKDLRPKWEGGKLFIDFRGRLTEVPLKNKPGEQDVTLECLNRALDPEYELRYVKASEGGDTIAFLVLPSASWREMEATYGKKLSRAFARIDSRSPLFENAELSPEVLDSIDKQMAPVHFARVVPRLVSKSRAAALLADPARAGASKPVTVPMVGDLVVTYFHNMLASDDEVTVGELQQYGVTLERLREYALANAACEWSKVVDESYGGLSKMFAKQRVESSTVALWDAFWEVASERNGSILAAFPQRDVVLFTRADSRDAVASLLEAVDCIDTLGDAALSRHVYAWGPSGWQIYEPSSNERTYRTSPDWLAAERGDLQAQFYVASQYQFMELYAEAVKWYLKAAQRALVVPRVSDNMFENGSASQCNLADKYEHGLGVPQDFEKALYWYGQSAAMGNEVAQYSLGNMYLHGRGVARDLEQASQWFQQSAQRGYEDAAFALRAMGR